MKVQWLLLGTLLTLRQRTVSAALRAVGLSEAMNFAQYHHVLNRAGWSAHQLSRILLHLLLDHLDQGEGTLVFGIDETIERRWGAKIRARGIYRDPVRSSDSHFVKTSGLRWVSLMWLTTIPWAVRIWALPVLTVLAPSERYYQTQKRQPKQLLDWARQMVLQLRRWLPTRPLVLVADSSYAALDFLHACQSLIHPVTVITRLRLDAALYAPAPPRTPATKGRPRCKGVRLPTLAQRLNDTATLWSEVTVAWYGGAKRTLKLASESAVWYHAGKPPVTIRWVLVQDPQGHFAPQAWLATDPQLMPLQIVEYFVRRWAVEVTFAQVRTHLGVETQRQWSDLAIARTTPLLLGLFSWVTLVAHHLQATQPLPVRTTAWYVKSLPTFADALAAVRALLWPTVIHFSMSFAKHDVQKLGGVLPSYLVELLCYST
jgi:hypothetical protein